ncbi:hypothetical protein BXZ70DRAFT_637447 [Cristinia sonorae]|uniref:Uncharacterized protein n=1 Tax=Cristinia sonorae TaxID=1940300 RepID=A0A8K0UEA0_9AGAR|nr:hypothetical protein BXZ70DRAFT_637447 [Cristinia sonorae]
MHQFFFSPSAFAFFGTQLRSCHVVQLLVVACSFPSSFTSSVTRLLGRVFTLSFMRHDASMLTVSRLLLLAFSCSFSAQHPASQADFLCSLDLPPLFLCSRTSHLRVFFCVCFSAASLVRLSHTNHPTSFVTYCIFFDPRRFLSTALLLFFGASPHRGLEFFIDTSFPRLLLAACHQ